MGVSSSVQCLLLGPAVLEVVLSTVDAIVSNRNRRLVFVAMLALLRSEQTLTTAR